MPMGTGLSPDCAEGNQCFIPYEVTVDVGGEVTWVNDDQQIHNVNVGLLSSSGPEEFDSGFMNAGDTFSYKFETPGTYDYICTLHPWMMGVVTVVAEGEMMDNGMMGDDEPKTSRVTSGEAMLEDIDMYSVAVLSGEPTAGERLEIVLTVADITTALPVEHLNYDILVTQDGETVLDETEAHSHTGEATHVTAPLDSGEPVDITVTLQGFGVGPIEERTGPIGEEAMYVNVVPEFGTIAMMVLAASIISIIAVTAKSRVIPRL